jgi:hypothetical protein
MLTFGEEAFGWCFRLTSVYFQGNAPIAVSSAFYIPGAVYESATIYYLPGTSGWSNSCGGEPAVLWNPLIQTADGSFGVRTNQFGVTIQVGTPRRGVRGRSFAPLDAAWTARRAVPT